MVVFEDGNIKDKNKNIVIRNAKRGTVLIDPRVYYERTLGTVNFTIAHECFHWYRHQPYHALMKMLGANDELGKIIQCSIGSNAKDSEKWKAVDWMEWQANGVAPHILMPTNTAKIKISELIEKYHIHFDGTDGYQIEEMISELADFYGLSKQAVKMRIREMGFAKVDGAFTYVNGQYVNPFSFDSSALTDNQSFTISSADLFKAYCLNKDFRKAIDTGKFVYVEGHVCLDDEKYIIHSEGRVKLTQYALSHMDECCLAFDKGYSYQSKYQGQKYYVQMMYKTPSQVAAQEYSFEMNAHNRTLLSQIQRASRSADAMRLYPGAFSETLVQLITDIYATALDYDRTAKTTKQFFAKVQNKIVKSDVNVAKNYLSEQEMRSLERIVSAYLDLAEDRAERHIPMTMEDWAKRLDLFLMADDREVLQDAGKITAEIAKAKAETEFEKYRVVQDRLFMSDFDRYMLELEENAKKYRKDGRQSE